MLLKWHDSALSMYCNLPESLTSVSIYIDSSIRLNVSSSTAISPKSKLPRNIFPKYVIYKNAISLTLYSCGLHGLVKWHRFCRFCLFFTFLGLTPCHVKTSDETIHQGCSQERKMSYNKFRQKNIEKYLKIILNSAPTNLTPSVDSPTAQSKAACLRRQSLYTVPVPSTAQIGKFVLPPCIWLQCYSIISNNKGRSMISTEWIPSTKLSRQD